MEQELSGVGNVDLRDAGLVVAGAALVFALLELTTRLLVRYYIKK